MAIEHLHIPADLVGAALTPEELEAGDLYDHLREHHRVRVKEATQSIEPTVVSEDEAALLDVPVLSPRSSSSASPWTRRAGPSSTSTRSTGATGTASSPAWTSPATGS